MTIFNRPIRGGHLEPVFIANDDNNKVPIDVEKDNADGAIITISVAHHEIHDGDMFITTYYAGSVGSGSAIQLLIQVGAINYAHMVFSGPAGGDARVRFYEGVTFTDAGTGLAEVNMNRASANVAEVTITHTPAGIAGGTVIYDVLEPGGQLAQSSGGSSSIRPNSEFILQRNTNYLLDITNVAGVAKLLAAIMQWYEENYA